MMQIVIISLAILRIIESYQSNRLWSYICITQQNHPFGDKI